MFCTACGIRNADDSNFCKQCGHALDRPTAHKVSEDAFERALPEEEQVSALLERAYRLRKADSVPGAIALCEAALRLKPDSTSAHSLLGQLYETNGERDLAVREYERVLQLNPGSIADRVKLDALRGATGVTPRPGSQPRIVLTDSGGRRNGLQWVTLAISGAALMLFGGVLALQLRPAETPRTPAKNPSVAALTQNAGPSFGPANARNPMQSENALTMKTPQKVTANPTETRVANAYPVAPFPYLYPQPQPPQPVYIPANNAPMRTHASPAASLHPSAAKTRAAADRPAAEEGSGHILLPGDTEGVQDNGQDQYVIPVKASNDSKRQNAAPSDSTAKNEKPNEGFVRITASKLPGSAPAGNAAASEAQVRIAMGREYFAKEDYTKALSAFQKALPTAGDDTGMVYQQIARCFQYKGDKASATTNYQRAISEYNRLIETGRQVETAKSGIRICEQGIKICSVNE
jgi:Tfp pilus assembly protein PilF